DRAPARGGVHERRVEADQRPPAVIRADGSQVGRPDRVIGDRELVVSAGPAVMRTQRLAGGRLLRVSLAESGRIGMDPIVSLSSVVPSLPAQRTGHPEMPLRRPPDGPATTDLMPTGVVHRERRLKRACERLRYLS